MCRIVQIIVFTLLCAAAVISVGQTRSTDSAELLKELLTIPAPPPRKAATPTDAAAKIREPNFFNPKNSPPDDTPIEDLMQYWMVIQVGNHNRPEPTEAVKRRLLEAVSSNPQLLATFLRLLPQTEATATKVKELYDHAQGNQQFQDNWRATVRNWLVFNSKYFLDELLAAASKAKDNARDDGVNREEELCALARVDWPSAEPLLRGLVASGQPRSTALALALFYKHAIDDKDLSGEERYRRNLEAIASNRGQTVYARTMAIVSLGATTWSGRDEWYLGLFQDETLLDPDDIPPGVSPLRHVFLSDPAKWTPVMARLVESKDINVRSAAALCLLALGSADVTKEALVPLLPWLSDPSWAKTPNKRLVLMQQLAGVDVPESVPGLIWVVENDRSEAGYERSHAASTLTRYRDPRAVPALKRALAREKTESIRQGLIRGLLACQGLTESEQVQALEAFATKVTGPEGWAEVLRYRSAAEEGLPISVSIGKYLNQMKEAPDALVTAVLARAEQLKSENAVVTKFLVDTAHQWQGQHVERDMIRRIANGSADATTIVEALKRKPRFRETVGPELQNLSAADGAAQGIGAVLLEDPFLAQSILTSGNTTAQTALLACSRLTQMPLPVEIVGSLLRSKDQLLSHAAEAYLLADDSPPARELLWQHHPNEAFVTGWREPRETTTNRSSRAAIDEEKLRAEILKENGPLEILALLFDAGAQGSVLRLYADKAVYTHYEDRARYIELTVSKAEVATLKDFLAVQQMLESGPNVERCHRCTFTTLLSLTKEKGRRVFTQEESGDWLQLREIFASLGAGDSAKVRYNLEKEIKGLEVLYASDDLLVNDVSQQGDQIRVWLERPEHTLEPVNAEPTEEEEEEEEEEDEALKQERRRREAERSKARFSWRVFANNKLGAITSAPDFYSIRDESKFLPDDEYDEFDYEPDRQVQVLSPDSIIIARNFDGLWKEYAGSKGVRLGSDDEKDGYSNPVITRDGKWVVVAKARESWDVPNHVVRINLQTGREFRVRLEPAVDLTPVVFVPTQNKILVRSGINLDSARSTQPAGPKGTKYYLVDAATGETQPVTGSFAPLELKGHRFLQPTEKPDEFWAAIADEAKQQTQIGRYNVKDFSFKLVMLVPHIAFDSMAMWIDASQQKVYLVYNGQLVRFPLQTNAPAR